MNLVQNTVPSTPSYLGPRHAPAGVAALATLRRDSGAARYQPAGDGAMAAFASALQARGGADGLAVLRGFEQAAAAASAEGLHWLAALAFEQAARHAGESGLVSVHQHYRRQSQEHYRQCEARGRALAPGDSACASVAADAPGRLCSPRMLALAIAHEVNQPLAALALHMGAACRWLRRAEPDVARALDSLAMAESAGRQAGAIVRGMQHLAGGETPDTARVAVDQVVKDALQPLRGRRHEHGIVLEQALGLGALCIEANGVQLGQVVTNLVVNAIEVHARSRLDGPRIIQVASRRIGAHEIEIAVTDNGPGIDPAHRKDVFTSLFSTKPARTCHGRGMGLSICLSIVRAHGGRIWFEPAAPQGACFRLRLPVDAIHQERSA